MGFLGIFVFLFVFLFFIFASRSGWVLGICGIFGSRFGKFILYSRRLVWVVPFGLLMIFSFHFDSASFACVRLVVIFVSRFFRSSFFCCIKFFLVWVV